MKDKSTQSRLRSGLSITLGSCLLLASCALCVAQTSVPTNRAPSGWILAGSKPASYRTGVDRAMTHEGQPSAYLQSAVPNIDGFGTLMQSIDAANYAGKRVRLRAYVKAQDVESAGMWMRVDKGKTMAVAFDNMQDRAIKGTQSWTSHDVVLDVPADATGISFGILLSGTGQVWMNHVTFEIVGNETPVTGTTPNQMPLSKVPVNLNFSD